ncbi:XRE family transcriptional regulator [Pseudorhizobium halotolerans]|uniref:XRE family transcriptional regulator n=1 Tax=Pseudorhizobium halotolerans TaxID=1233081 RepID=A0ABM8PYR8_9HYPH|nr:helix-turn-helix transcriptional regulator [Pseudorhizobium halotolerans]CAD7055259.1 XRE family transcriptional regulator [Pseudorhizobium halotolerans]
METEEQQSFRRELGARIGKIAGRFPTKGEAAAAAGVSVEQLNKWIAGTVKVPADGLKSLANAANVDFSWLVAGEAASTDVDSGFIASVDISIIGVRVADLVVECYRRNGIKMPEATLAREVIARLSQLYKKADNPKDMEELFSLLPWLEKAIDRELGDAAAEPGTGKRSAS